MPSTIEKIRAPVSGWIQTSTGKQFFLQRPRPELIDIEDIAIALSRICRFGGHLRPDVPFYSVAQHSVLVSLMCREHPLVGLLHDAHEAYLGDIVRPLKEVLYAIDRNHQLQATEWAIDAAIAEALRAPRRLMAHAEVKHADNVALATEKRDLMAPEPWPWHPLPEPLAERIEPLMPDAARRLFLERYAALKGAKP